MVQKTVNNCANHHTKKKKKKMNLEEMRLEKKLWPMNSS